ncbi:YbaK/EbsC family protein [Streptomyces sp. NPDC004658]|uniref:YbaK/EbsC family protein n=1 Tax=Streptomyces sp. NPDC004658 TaxID=3154672 RepID=UPI0033BF74D7
MPADILTEAGAHRRLMDLLDAHAAGYRVIDHPPEGRTVQASALRGHPLRQAAKCLVLRVAGGPAGRGHVLAVVPGDRRVDTDAVAALSGRARAAFADRATAERLTGCASGAVIPFSFDARLTLVVDRDLLDEDEIYFNAARLDQSVALTTRAYRRIAAPLVAPISTRGSDRKAISP